ncbi:hypothetical protein PV325_006257 [Microctonus aethiopoides]|nr:hypothetical protein PV325_006257 [Microctonus aethiopoides]
MFPTDTPTIEKIVLMGLHLGRDGETSITYSCDHTSEPKTVVESQKNSVNCNNTIGELGQCVNVKNCQPILKLLQNQRLKISDFLRYFICNTDHQNPKVCCPTVSELKHGPLFPPHCGIPVQNEKEINQSDTIITFPSRISTGESAKLGAWPWVAAIGYESEVNLNEIEWKCSGSLISSRHIITAAHCIRPNMLVVRLGDLNLRRDDDGANPVDFAIEKFEIHPYRNVIQKTHDIAVLKLQNDVHFTDFIRPICLPIFDEFSNENFIDRTAIIIGWGKLGEANEKSDHLQQAKISVVDQQNCKKVYRRFPVIIDENVICAGDSMGQGDACQGDSGGPLMLSINNVFYEIGIISYGIVCGHPNIPGVYTAINRNLDFIISQLN